MISSTVLHDGAHHTIEMPRGCAVGDMGDALQRMTGSFLGCRLFREDGVMLSLSEQVHASSSLISVRTENPYELQKVAFDHYSDPLTREIIFGVRDERVDDEDPDGDEISVFTLTDGVLRHAGHRFTCTRKGVMLSHAAHIVQLGGGGVYAPDEEVRFQCREALLGGVHCIHFDVDMHANPYFASPPSAGEAVSVGVCLANGSHVSTPLTLTCSSPLFGLASYGNASDRRQGPISAENRRPAVRVVCSLDTTCSPPSFTATACLRCDVDNVHGEDIAPIGGTVHGSADVATDPGTVHGSADVATDATNDGFRWFVRCRGSVMVAPCATSWSEWVE
jgi:hypothetical protein